MNHDRRNDYDVTNTIQVSNPTAVRDAVQQLFSQAFPGASFDKLWLAFYNFERLFRVMVTLLALRMIGVSFWEG